MTSVSDSPMLFSFVEFQGLIAIAFSLCPLIAYFATFDAIALLRLTLYLLAKVARSLQYHAGVADRATAFSRLVRHHLCVRGNRLAWLSSAHTGQYSGVGAAARSFDEWCSTRAIAPKSCFH
jgi:hypothetical protein